MMLLPDSLLSNGLTVPVPAARNPALISFSLTAAERAAQEATHQTGWSGKCREWVPARK